MIARYHGRIVKLMCDGALIEFPSVVDALACSMQMQRAIPTLNETLAEEQRIELRVGINLGDIIVEGDDLYGDGVNITARLESLAEPGGICLSPPEIQVSISEVNKLIISRSLPIWACVIYWKAACVASRRLARVLINDKLNTNSTIPLQIACNGSTRLI